MDTVNTEFENWGVYLMKQFQTMYEKGERCDLEISCNKQIFLVHRLIMSACSDYIRDLSDKQHIILPNEISCKALKTVIDFVYSGKIMFCKSDKEELLLASSLLNMRLLTELIKMEESCPFTLSMDDEPEENRNENEPNNDLSPDAGNPNDVNIVEQNPYISSSQPLTKRKSPDVKTSRPRPNRNTVLPPVFKFPYLHQKLNSSRSYGLITVLTDAEPSRLEISEVILRGSGYQSAFEDVTYETQVLFPDTEFLTPLQPAHHQFLKKIKESSGYKRSYSNALYSPFDKYTPPYTSNTESAPRKRELGPSYLTALETTPAPALRRNQPPKAPEVRKKSVTFSKEPEIIVEKPIVAMEIDMKANETCIDDIEMELPQPITPVESFSGEIPPEISGMPPSQIGETVELIKLNNAIMPAPENDIRSSMNEEFPDVSISVIASNVSNDSADVKQELMHCEESDSGNPANFPEASANATETFPNSEAGTHDISNTSEPAPVDSVSTVEDVSVNTTEAPPVTPEAVPVSLEKSNVISIVPEATSRNEISILPDQMEEETNDNISGTTEKISHENEIDNEARSNAEPEISAIDGACEPAQSNSIDSITSDSTVFTAVDQNNVREMAMNPNSQIFALKVKGTENPAQLSKLVDLCKKNPLFKNKNVKFKIVPVKGAIPNALKESTKLSSKMLSKAIIVKRTELETMKTKKAIASPAKKTETVPNIENVTGPWECGRCGNGGKPVKFYSYFEYRSHLQDVHNEANNPVYCAYCGYKSQKRNMQLYHLFTKHNIPPPANVQFPKCDKCDYYALNDYYLQKHATSHTSTGTEFVCSCKMAFKTSDLLQKHMLSNDCKNSKNFTCGYCRSIFDRFVNLKAHMRVCMKERAKPGLQNNVENNSERNVKTVSEGGKDYVSL